MERWNNRQGPDGLVMKSYISYIKESAFYALKGF